MEELSIEEKANRYDEAIERAIAWRKKYVNTTISEDGTMIQDFDNIFSELKESEDEKIKNILKNIVKCACDNYGIKYQGQEIGEEKLLAWLEKKSEQKPAWSEKDEKMLGKCIDAASGYYSPEDEPNMKDWLRAIKGRILPQPLHVWSEEDEKALDSMLNDIKQGVIPDNDDINWLKLLKERVQPQPKQEWSDEDEKARLTTEFVLMKSFGVGTPLVDWLRKLKDRATA